MGLRRGVEARPLESIQGGMAQFYTPQSSNETMLVRIPGQTIDDLFVHKFQTDQLLVVKGCFILVVLHNRQLEYFRLSEEQPQVVTVPPGVPHGAINLEEKECWLVNAVLRHSSSHPRDYTPMPSPLPYNLELAQHLQQSSLKLTAPV